MKNEKRLIQEKKEISSFDCRTLKEVHENIAELISEHGENARFDIDTAFYPYSTDLYISFKVCWERKETDEEYKTRAAKEREHQARVEQKERERLAELLKKYGKV